MDIPVRKLEGMRGRGCVCGFAATCCIQKGRGLEMCELHDMPCTVTVILVTSELWLCYQHCIQQSRTDDPRGWNVRDVQVCAVTVLASYFCRMSVTLQEVPVPVSLHVYSAFQVYRPIKGLYNNRYVSAFTHTHTLVLVVVCLSGAVKGQGSNDWSSSQRTNSISSHVVWHVSQGSHGLISSSSKFHVVH